MRILVLGGDGYLGWPTAMHFAARNCQVLIVDNYAKRRWEAEVGARPLIALPDLGERTKIWNRVAARNGFQPIEFEESDIADDYATLVRVLGHFRPDTIIHYAEQPSAPYSMGSRLKAIETQQNNVVGTLNVMFAMRDILPQAHLVKLGTMGEYGTPNIDIEEGWLDLEHNGRTDRVLYPKKPGSLYHLSKVHDSANLEFACRVWNLRVTDLNQGVVYGIETDETALAEGLHTSFHYDAVFGTVLNRFALQTVTGAPLTVYGRGTQRRGFLNIRDTLSCVELASKEPAAAGEFRVFNQMTQQFSVRELATMVAEAAAAEGYEVKIDFLSNPRVEQEDHYYNVKHSGLLDLGLTPHLLSADVIRSMIRHVALYRSTTDSASLQPSIEWRKGEQGPSARIVLPAERARQVA